MQKKCNLLDPKMLEVTLELALTVVDHQQQPNQEARQATESSNDADDEGHDEVYLFPCHITFDNCHTGLLADYHGDHLRSSRSSTQLVKDPKLCQYVVKQMFLNLRTMPAASSMMDLNPVVSVLKKLNKVCTQEKKNCRILGNKTDVLSLLLENNLYLLKVAPERQHIYLEPILDLVFTLADYKITGPQLKQIFEIIKDEHADLNVTLRALDRILSHHQRIMRNIQPLRSINFPSTSRTTEEIELSDPYISNSWHWRLRTRVDPNSEVRPSWLECPLITPLSNISPLITDGELRLCCSMWMSVCGDLLITDGHRCSKTGATSRGDWVRLKKRRKQTSGAGYMKSDLTNQKDNSKKLLHLISFAFDTLTIELWLNVSKMTFCARACRLGRGGQVSLLKQAKFPSHLRADGSWSHLMIRLVESTESDTERAMNMKITINGVNNKKAKLTYANHKTPLANFACLLGCDRSTFGYVWKLAQFHIYRGVPEKLILVFLLGKGPDFWTFTKFRPQQQSTLPLPDLSQRSIRALMSPKILHKYGFINQEELALNWLTQNVVIAYVAHQPDYFLDYSPNMSSGLGGNLSALMTGQPMSASDKSIFSNSAERFIQARTLNFTHSLKFSHNSGFGSALVEAGGIESALMAFADVIRRSPQAPITHSLAFSMLLKMSRTNQHHLNKFLDELNGLKLTEFILTHAKCVVSRPMLESYLDYCLVDGGAAIGGGFSHQIAARNRPNHCLIKSPKLIYHLMSSWRAWHKDLKVAKLLYRRLTELLQPADTHSRSRSRQYAAALAAYNVVGQHEERKLESVYIDYNFRMITSAGGIDILMSILRECLVPLDDENIPQISQELVGMIVNLISLLIKHPPGLDVMLDIMEFLFFLHPDPKAYVETGASAIAFMKPLNGFFGQQDEENDELTFDGQRANSRARTPESEPELARVKTVRLEESSTGDSGEEEKSRYTVSSSSNEDVYRGLRGSCISEEDEDQAEGLEEFADENLAQSKSSGSIRQDHNFVSRSFERDQSEARQTTRSPQPVVPVSGEGETERESTRNYAIALIADMLASIVKLTLTNPMNILSESLRKSIIDPRKLIILANNNSSLVREKVLRLFLYCIRACYSLKLRSILIKYEQEPHQSINKSSHPPFKACIPLQLMARQLLKYPTTMKMIQLCYGIIVSIDDFEAVETVCLTFDIETLNNGLQLNTLMLLIQLIPQLQSPQDMESALRFVRAYLRQLLKLAQIDTVGVLIKNGLIDTVMRIYFTYVERELARPKGDEDGADERATRRGSSDNERTRFEAVKQELDRITIFSVRYYIQNLTTNEAIKSIEELLLYCDLMNTCVPPRWHHILRDRQAKILLVTMRYCRHYEMEARKKQCAGKMEYYLRTLFKDNELNTFDNMIPEQQLLEIQSNGGSLPSDEPTFGGRASSSTSSDSSTFLANKMDGTDELDDNTSESAGDSGDTNDSDDDLLFSTNGNPEDNDDYNNAAFDVKNISELDVLTRFRATFELAIAFVTMRESGAIPSPLERQFVLKLVKVLSDYLGEYDTSKTNSRFKQQARKSRWNLMLAKLERTIRSIFSKLVLYLISSCDSMNLDERKYYAFTLLDMFSIDQLIGLLEEDADRSVHKILLVFVNDLIEFNKLSFMFDDSASDQEEQADILVDDTENKLRLLAQTLEIQLGIGDGESLTLVNNGHGRQQQVIGGSVGTLAESRKIDSKFRDIWLADLAQRRDDARTRLDLIKNANSGTRMGGLLTSMLDLSVVNGGDDSSLLADRPLDEAVSITRDVVNDKNEQRKLYLEDLKQTKVYNYHIRQQWLSLIIGHTHERAIWYVDSHYPKSWELNPVEGPSRIRRRLRPCKLALDKRFLRSPGQNSTFKLHQGPTREGEADEDDCAGNPWSAQRDDWYNQYSPHPLCSLVINQEQSLDSNELRIRMFTTDKIHFNCDCSIIRPNEVCDGEVSIASWCIHFIGERCDSYQQHLQASMAGGTIHERNYQASGYSPGKIVRGTRSMTPIGKFPRIAAFTSTVVEDLWFDEIVEIWDRRYQLQDVGLEIFLTNNMTYLISFRSNRDREDFKHNLMREQHKMINLQRFNLNTSLNRLTNLWREGRLTNFDYLTCLNKLAGRSFNDLMQYPVFPFVLSNYTRDHLDLTKESEFRKLRKPMAIQEEEKEANFVNNYQISQTTNLSVVPCGMNKPYHYSNHYSNSATVLHFLVRLPPFTQMLIQYQDNNFDQPDRTFHSIASTWQLITHDSNTDFKELIPEFFFLPEMFINFEQFEMGAKQNNELVDDVKLPPWCPNSDARLFTLIHRQALESAQVSENLHHWIDLIFGYKQTGKAAVDAINVFHPATYYGEFDLATFQLGSSTATLRLSPTSSNPLTPTLAHSVAGGGLTPPNSRLTLNYSSDYITTATDGDASALGSGSGNNLLRRLKAVGQQQQLSFRRQQADIERSALETMIKTYGQMPRQLFVQPVKQRSMSTFVQHQLNLAYMQQQNTADDSGQQLPYKRMEPLRQVTGLRWGSFVGSPDEPDMVAVKHKRIKPVEESIAGSQMSLNPRSLRGSLTRINHKRRDKWSYVLHLLPNGEVAIMRSNTSLMLDYRADRKPSGSYQLSLPSTRYSWRAGLSSIARMNLFSSMIISRQQFSFIEPKHYTPAGSTFTGSSSGNYDTFNSTSSSLVSITAPRVKFSLDSLSLVSWLYLDGTIRIRHPATNQQKPSLPLLQANTIVDTMSTCASVPELNLLLVGYESGAVCAHIVSTYYETAPIATTSGISPDPSSPLSGGIGSNQAAAPSAVHFLHTTTIKGSPPTGAPLGPGKVREGSYSTGEPYTAVSLAGKTLHSIRSINKTTRWLYCHSKRVNCIKINVSFGIVVTGSDDGTSAIWDLNSLTYVRTIDYKLDSVEARPRQRNNKKTPTHRGSLMQNQRLLDYLCSCDLPRRPRSNRNSVSDNEAEASDLSSEFRPTAGQIGGKKCSICESGISAIAVSDTLGDIVTVKDINNRLALTTDFDGADDSGEPLAEGEEEEHELDVRLQDGASARFEADPFENENSDSSRSRLSLSALSEQSDDDSALSSLVYVHTINGALVGFVNCHTQVTAVCYSHAPEGISVNVIVIGLADGSVRLYSSWDLKRVKEFRLSDLNSPISSIMYSRDNQLLYVAYGDGQLVVLRNKKKGSVGLPKEWFL